MMFSKPLSRKERDDDRRRKRLKNVRTISSNELEILDTLGEGGFGKVSKGQYSNKTFAFKYPNGFRELIDEQSRLAFQDEAAKQWNLRHVNIVHLYAIVNESSIFGLVMEYLEKGDMKKYIMSSKVPVPAKDVCLWMKDVSEGMQYLHAQPTPIIHGDLKIENVLISNEGRAKITDFGLAFWKDYSKTHSVNNVVSGTLRNIPPEYLKAYTLRKDEKFDVYGFSIFMWESIMKRTAFEGGNNAMIPIWVQNKQRPPLDEFPKDYSSLWKNLIENCWEMEPKARPLFPKICQQLARILKENLPRKSLDDVDMVDGIGSQLGSNAESATKQDVEMVYGRLSGADVEIKGTCPPVGRGDKTEVRHIEKALKDIPYRTEKSKLRLNTNEGQFQKKKYLTATHEDWGPVIYKPTILRQNVDYGNDLTYFLHEIQIHRKSKHPNILELIGIVHEPGDFGLVLEQIHFGTMKHFIQCFPTMSSPEKLRTLKDVSVGLSYLHSLKPPIIHCWVKPESVYVYDDNQVKLSDFQFAQEKTKDAKLDISRFVVDGKPATYHIPVEYFKNPKLPLSEAIDTYGFAWVIIEVLSTVDVIKTLQQLYPRKNILELVSGLEPCRFFPNDVSKRITDIVNSCFDKDQEKWPSIADIGECL